MYYVITYGDCLIVWVRRIQTYIALSTTVAEYISLLQAMMDVIPFVINMKEIEFILELWGDTLKVLFGFFGNSVKIHGDNQGAVTITIAVAPQMRPDMKHIAINYHKFQSFFVNGDVEIQHIDTKEQITDTFTNPLDFELFVYLGYKIIGW